MEEMMVVIKEKKDKLLLTLDLKSSEKYPHSSPFYKTAVLGGISYVSRIFSLELLKVWGKEQRVSTP